MLVKICSRKEMRKMRCMVAGALEVDLKVKLADLTHFKHQMTEGI